MRPSGGPAPEIDYPTRWRYRVVGTSEASLRALIAEVCGAAEHEILGVRPSRAGTYVSVHLAVVVRDEAHRTGVHRALAAHADVRVVL